MGSVNPRRNEEDRNGGQPVHKREKKGEQPNQPQYAMTLNRREARQQSAVQPGGQQPGELTMQTLD